MSQVAEDGDLRCSLCQQTPETLFQCSVCQVTRYCTRECQKKDWKRHRKTCGKAPPGLSLPSSPKPDRPWYYKIRSKRLDDGSYHEGELELITWNGVDDGEKLGFGGVPLAEAAALKRKFEVEMNGDLKALYRYNPSSFRWTCCGSSGGNPFGCDHHGRGKEPCKCDFCHMGQKVPSKIYQERKARTYGVGLDLPRGPDPRSYNPRQATLATLGRSMLGLDV